MNDDAPKRRGRPPIAQEDRKAGNLTFRTRANLREQLEEAAQQSGRSVSEEIEHRLQTSFDRNAVAMQVYGSHGTDLIKALGQIFMLSRGMGSATNPYVCLAALTTIMTYAKKDIHHLIEASVDPSVWLYLSRAGIMQACDMDEEAAEEAAQLFIPEMGTRMAEYRIGAEMAQRLKQEKKG